MRVVKNSLSIISAAIAITDKKLAQWLGRIFDLVPYQSQVPHHLSWATTPLRLKIYLSCKLQKRCQQFVASSSTTSRSFRSLSSTWYAPTSPFLILSPYQIITPIDIAMPATCNGTSDQSRSTAPYSLVGTSSQWNLPSQVNPTNNPQATATPTPISGQNTLPQFLNQLSNILQQTTSSSVTHAQAEEPDTIEDDCLSAALQPVQSILPVMQPPTGCTPPVSPVSPQSTPLLFQPTLPPIPTKIKEKIARGEYIDFTTILPKSMFGASESQSQTLTLQLTPSRDNYLIKPPASTTKRITSFSAWVEAWSLYLSIRVFLDPSCAPHPIAYQRIITTANSDHPLQSWISYGTRQNKVYVT